MAPNLNESPNFKFDFSSSKIFVKKKLSQESLFLNPLPKLAYNGGLSSATSGGRKPSSL